MYKIKIQKRAIKSITKTIKYISQDSVFYANQVQEYIYKSIKLLEDFPFLGTDIGGYRKIIFKSKFDFR